MSWMPRRLILLLAGSLLLLVPLLSAQLATGSGRAYGCVCAPIRPTLEALEKADAVFTGRVVSVGTFTSRGVWSVELGVETVWKGSVRSTTFVWVSPEAACGYSGFRLGKKFLVYAHHANPHRVPEDEDALHVSYCGRTQPLEHAGEDLREIGEGRNPGPGVTGPDSVSASRDPLRSLAWWAPLLAGLAAAALIIRRWTRHRELE